MEAKDSVSPMADFDFSGLTVPERIALAQALWESVRDQVEREPLTETELAEVRWRVNVIDAALMACEPFDAVMGADSRTL